jgi:hypothetical protein
VELAGSEPNDPFVFRDAIGRFIFIFIGKKSTNEAAMER